MPPLWQMCFNAFLRNNLEWKKILSFFIALKSCVPLALKVQMKRCVIRQGEPLVISLISQWLNPKVRPMTKGLCFFNKNSVDMLSRCKQAETQDSWKMKTSNIWKLHSLSFKKRVAFWKAAFRYNYSDAIHISGNNKVDACSLRREVAHLEKNLRSCSLYQQVLE